LLFLPVIVLAEDNEKKPYSVDLFFESRFVIGVVEFSARSSELSVTAKHNLDKILESIRQAQSEKKIVRFEGYMAAPLSNYQDVNLAMYRAKSVQDYLRNRHGIRNTVFLNCQNNFLPIKSSTKEIVEIVAYRDIFTVSTAPIAELITSE